MIIDSEIRYGIEIKPQDIIARRIKDNILLLENIFKIISPDTQKGRRIRKPLYDTLRLVANIYLREGHYTEYKTMLDAVHVCIYDGESRKSLEKDEKIYEQLYSINTRD